MAAKHGKYIKTFQILFSLYLTMMTAVATPASKLQQSSTADDAEKSVKFSSKNAEMTMAANDYSPITLIHAQEEQQFLPTPISIFSTTPQPPQISPRIDHQYYNTPRFLTPPAANRAYHEPTHYVQVPPSSNRAQYQRSYDAPISSADFGVLRGGTFYPKEELPYHKNEEYSDYSDYYGGDTSSGGNGRPAAAEFIQKYTYPEEQFENFRDFANLNMEGIDGDFSQLSPIYTSSVSSKNSTKSVPEVHPRNIFEQLELIDREKALAAKKQKVTAITSKSKVKLAATKLEKSYKKQSDARKKFLENEPLLALS